MGVRVNFKPCAGRVHDEEWGEYLAGKWLLLALNSGLLQRSKWSGIETAADDLPASSVPPPLALKRPSAPPPEGLVLPTRNARVEFFCP
jgi:hypothetical protein